jgi:SAM-dependent methyltransferase
MNIKNSDVEWEKWGKNDPYFGVITKEKFRSHNLSDESLKEFFDSGKGHIRNIIDVSKRFIDHDFSPRKVFDFGCGVGRLLIGFSEIADQVVGLDVSESMLTEALINCNRYSINNVSLIKSDDTLSVLKGNFDFIHSFIVFQHIPVDRGVHIFRNLLDHLEDGGICAIQFIYSHSTLGKSFRLPVIEHSNGKLFKNLKSQVRRVIKIVNNTVSTRKNLNLSIGDPEMQMNLYNLDELFQILQSHDITNIHIEFTDHDGVLGVFLYFQKPQQAKQGDFIIQPS